MARRVGQRMRGGLIEVASRGPRVDEPESRRPQDPGEREPGHAAMPPASPGRRASGSSTRGPVLGLPALVQAAVKEVARLILQPRWTVALAGAVPEPPVLVERLDRPEEYYAIVGFRIGRRLTARVRMHAHTGTPGATSGIETPAGVLTPYRTPDDARVAATGYWDGCRRLDDPDDVVVAPFLVWRPSPASPSAFQPFYRVRHRTTDLYYRVDGRLFVTLGRGSGV